jgi:Xaa-Pro aminopeptidase
MELAAKLDCRIRCLGGTNGFDAIIAFGPNCSRNHHQPGRRKLRKNDTILIDFGARVNGYTCDITRCFVFGRASAKYRKTYLAVAQAQKAAISTIRAGQLLSHADSAARRVLSDKGLAVYGHGTGHGLGLQVHENPYISRLNKKGRFEAGQVVTVEPGVYVPGRLGVRLEDDVLVAENGCRILTRHKLWFDPEKLHVLPGR